MKAMSTTDMKRAMRYTIHEIDAGIKALQARRKTALLALEALGCTVPTEGKKVIRSHTRAKDDFSIEHMIAVVVNEAPKSSAFDALEITRLICKKFNVDMPKGTVGSHLAEMRRAGQLQWIKESRSFVYSGPVVLVSQRAKPKK